MNDKPTRRRLFALLGALPLVSLEARGEEGQEYPLKSDSGEPVVNFRISAELDPANLPGIVWKGPKSADVTLYEWFDYNCGYCKQAARELDDILAQDKRLRLGLINNAMLSIASVQAAKVQQGLFRLHGPAAAYDFHMRMFARRGQNDGTAALDVVRAMGLDVDKVTESANNHSVSEVLTRQARLAQSLGMSMTPTFAVTGVGLLGWPGAGALKTIIANARKCDHPVCG